MEKSSEAMRLPNGAVTPWVIEGEKDDAIRFWPARRMGVILGDVWLRELNRNRLPEPVSSRPTLGSQPHR